MSDRITVSEFIRRHPDVPSKIVKRWVYSAASNGLLADRIVSYTKGQFRIVEQAFLRWLDVHGDPPKPVRKVGGLSIKALDGRPAPRLLPVLSEAVPKRGRVLSLFERAELADWGLSVARLSLRAVPTANLGEFSLWKVKPKQVFRLPYLLTFSGSSAGSWVTTADLPKDRQPRRKNPAA
jgi:hypothetical protein